jgi:hypothetical protein
MKNQHVNQQLAVWVQVHEKEPTSNKITDMAVLGIRDILVRIRIRTSG